MLPSSWQPPWPSCKYCVPLNTDLISHFPSFCHSYLVPFSSLVHKFFDVRNCVCSVTYSIIISVIMSAEDIVNKYWLEEEWEHIIPPLTSVTLSPEKKNIESLHLLAWEPHLQTYVSTWPMSARSCSGLSELIRPRPHFPLPTSHSNKFLQGSGHLRLLFLYHCQTYVLVWPTPLAI